jgi:hypothetical protein
VFNKVGEELPSFLGGDCRMDNDIIAWLPVSGSSHPVPVGELKSWKWKTMNKEVRCWQVMTIVFDVQSTALKM